MNISDIKAKNTNGDEVSLSDYAGKVLLIVNTATGCGLAPQFRALESLWQEYRERWLVVLGFPSDQFFQESVADTDMVGVCSRDFSVTFPMFARVRVNGSEAHPLYQFLKSAKGWILTDDIKWNFTKFLVDRSGTVVNRYAPTTPPESIARDIEALIG